MLKTRVRLYTDPEAKRRIELAAAKYNMPVTQYCFEAVRQQLEEDDLWEREAIEIPVKQTQKETRLFDEMRTLHQQIKIRRQGKPIAVEKIMNEMHAEREYENMDLP